MSNIPADPVHNKPTCAICLKPVEVGVLRVVVWAAEHGASIPDNTPDDEAALAIVHRECFIALMHPDYVL